MNTTEPEKQTVDEWLDDYNNAEGTFFWDGKIMKYKNLDEAIRFTTQRRKIDNE